MLLMLVFHWFVLGPQSNNDKSIAKYHLEGKLPNQSILKSEIP